ncbi:hypothetical protein AVEN_201885-1 [Araneus ventricosus]|uniref:F-box domain-containing protein n=1 Tax=Araneus ventricosus TaxID=182803 RepID=A0A4Y2G7P6_ARAVE|nr:hypothetical protein AVEN_201885-1 [Araneus ventricosus]
MADWILSNEEYYKQVKWCELPSPALEKIYSFASRDDQLNMSVVCRKWCEEFRSSVCKTFRFDLTESQLSIRTCPRMIFVQKYSSMFRHVEVFYKFTWENHLMYTWCKHFQEFLQILASKTQLISINFRDLSGFFHQIDNSTSNEICGAIANFLESQHHLRRVEFHNCDFISYKGVELLLKQIENNSESLTHLVLQGFVRWRSMETEEDTNAAINLPTLLGLPRFTTLETEYLPTFVITFNCQSAAIQKSKNRQTRVPQKIILNYRRNLTKVEAVGGLTSTDWWFLKKIYPDLEVEFNFSTNSPSLREAKLLIMPNMPITRLDYRYVHDSPFYDFFCREVNVLFDHLLACKTSDYLVSLHFRWSERIFNSINYIIFNTFLLACKKLKCLELYIEYPANGIVVLLESWLENRPESLEKVRMVSGYEVEYGLVNLITVHVNRLRLVGLNVEVDFMFDR